MVLILKKLNYKYKFSLKFILIKIVNHVGTRDDLYLGSILQNKTLDFKPNSEISKKFLHIFNIVFFNKLDPEICQIFSNFLQKFVVLKFFDFCKKNYQSFLLIGLGPRYCLLMQSSKVALHK